ncbi:LPXTG cell wall anchor domain-containing protein [Glycomyces harbinensis]|uniref:LPXTG-motif cell wall anchor domain-containing protein n=1 Tax=Glycomyces harbinensis TaxID=58114 RepID=A0A1G7CQC3_9ACTN|nr:LPXTG cell wall anchor domain-containing protein [Glycomyces harbinensis]SDE40695.1 LPXTG-motif cell wall anchor domain-containing protein [Glycomyces harbinensis]
MKLTRRHKTIGIGAAAGIAGAVALAFAVPALADDDATIGINPGNVPATAAGFGDRSCDQIPEGTADWLDGWVFVLPNSVPAEGNFHYIEAVFQDEDGNVLRYNTADDGGIVDGSGDNKAYIITPAGLTLIDAEATVDLEDDGGGNGNGGGKEPRFNLTHTCPATEDEPGEETPSEEPTSPSEEPSSPTEEPSSPTEEPSSPTEEPTSPTDETPSPTEESTTSEEPSSPTEEPTTESEAPTSATEEPTTPGEETSTEVEESSSPAESSSEPAASNSAPGEASTSPAGSFLPTTGSSLTFVLVAAGALVIAGGVILAFMRRRREPEEG